MFTAWLGVMMYLAPGVSDRVIAELAGLARTAGGGELVLTFAHPKRPSGPDGVAASAVLAGEPWFDRAGPAEIVRRLRAAGFSGADIVPAALLAERYFPGRTDLPAPRRSSLAVAAL
jgi:O-methyltransferase involved in polyketide biosynthesis